MIKRKIRRVLAVLMTFAMLSSAALAASFPDMPNDWSTEALEHAVQNGLLKGDGGKINPNDNLTRAQMAAVVSRVFGATEKAPLDSYTDVAPGAWYYDDMAKAVNMGVFTGNGSRLDPEGNITRQEAFAVLARAFDLPGGDPTALSGFKDKDSVSSWASGAVSALVGAGYVGGSNGYIRPASGITRAEFAKLMDSLVKTYFSVPGTYTNVTAGNVMINAADVTLKGVTVTGDLIIGDGVGDGTVTLSDVTVTGRTVVRGGGINSVRITGTSKLQNIVIARVNGEVRVYAEDGTEIGQVTVDGRDDVILEGNVGTVTVKASGVTVTATDADVTTAAIEGENSKIVVGAGSSVGTLTVNAPNASVNVTGQVKNVVVNGEGTTVTGDGRVGHVDANTNNVRVTTPDTDVTAARGTTGVFAGTNPVSGGNTVNTTVSGTPGDGAQAATADLTGLNLSGSPTGYTFAPGTYVYNGVTVDNSVSSVTVTPAGSGTITVNGTPVASGAASGAISLTAGVEETITVVARETGKTAKTYTIKVTRALPSVPTISAIIPNAGPLAGGTVVTITGTNFAGTPSVTFGGNAATNVAVVDSTTITARTPAHAVGAVDVVVTTADGTTTSTSGYTYMAAPTITGISPNAGPLAGGTTVTITGTSLSGATAVTFGGTAATSFAVDSAAQIRAVIPAGTAGAVDVGVTTAGGTATSAGAFTYTAAPIVTGISPNVGPIAGAATVTITGVNLSGVTAVTFGGTTGIIYSIDSATQIRVITPAHAVGTVTVEVTTPDGTATCANGYTYSNVPTITAITPDAGPLAGGTTVTIKGTNFTGASVTITIDGTLVNSQINSPTQIIATTQAHAAGAVDVSVTTSYGAATGTYTYIAAPTITVISPNYGPDGGGTDVTITGTNFTEATSVTFDGTPATDVTLVNGTTITVKTPAHEGEIVDVSVTTPGGTATCTGGYAYTSLLGSTVGGSGSYKDGDTIPFDTPFAIHPAVFVTAYDAGGNPLVAIATAVSTSGFTLKLYDLDNNTITSKATVYWMAFTSAG